MDKYDAISKHFGTAPLVIDVETTNNNFGDSLHPDNHLLLTGIYDANKKEYTDYVENELIFPQNVLKRLQETQSGVFLVGHNIKFDLRWLAKAGLDISKVRVWDTMLAEKVLLGNNPEFLVLSLDETAKRYGFAGKEEIGKSTLKKGDCLSTQPISWVKNYCRQDVMLTYKIFLEQVEKISIPELKVLKTRCLFTPVLADIETKGLHLDPIRTVEVHNEAVKVFNTIHTALKSIADINWNSGKQKAEVLYNQLKFNELTKRGDPIRTPKGAPKTDIATITNLKATTKVQSQVQELIQKYSKTNAQIVKSLRPFLKCINENKLLYANFTQHRAATHRTTSVANEGGVQFQNLPRIFKRLFSPRNEDWFIVEADGTNLEFRVAVELGRDPQGLKDILNPEFDAHQVTADTLTAAGQPTDRQTAKGHTFKPLFGGTSGTKAEQTYYQSFKERYKEVTRTQLMWKQEALKTLKHVTPWGLTFHYPNNYIVPSSGYHKGGEKICNYPIQSFATAEIIPIAATNLWQEMKKHNLKSFIVNTVHDSVIIEAPEEEREILNKLIQHAFTTHCYNYIKENYGMDFKTPLEVDITWGKHWNEQ